MLAAAFYYAVRFSEATPLQTDLLALLPKTEADPVAERSVQQLAGAMGDRVFFALSSTNAEHAKDAARSLGKGLAGDGALRHVVAELPPFDLSGIASFYLPYRFGLLSNHDRALLRSGAPSFDDILARRVNQRAARRYLDAACGRSVRLARTLPRRSAACHRQSHDRGQLSHRASGCQDARNRYGDLAGFRLRGQGSARGT
ncbi:hypothetical protein [Candidatus Burkholderia verschuerenii]|uniref:hypothetical protein n=1 Tax=Candidatus Burkholderia verschuerenii TaxID=242163 RepID=UPI001E38BC51|nr:hypothetical protein [Candidatus Burkholderia verschuerenii]